MLEIPHPLNRIVSLVPSQTELLFSLGLDNEIIAVTRYCLHPRDKVKHKPKVGGTKKVDIPGIRQLQPQLIIANKEENDRLQVEMLARDFPTWVSDVSNLDQALSLINDLGCLADRAHASSRMIQEIKQAFVELPAPSRYLKALYLIWRKPFMTVGRDTFIHNMMHLSGFQNVIHETRYPQLTATQIAALKPQVILLSSEPYPFSSKHIQELKVICPQAQVCLVDGEVFSWHGSRLLKAPHYFRDLRERI